MLDAPTAPGFQPGGPMRREWEPEELIACWTLMDADWRLVANKSGATRLGFAVLLKFFELTGADRETQEISMLALHLLRPPWCTSTPSSFKRVLQEPQWADRLADDDRRGLTPLFWSNINPYGTFRLDMDRRLDLDRGPTAPVTALG